MKTKSISTLLLAAALAAPMAVHADSQTSQNQGRSSSSAASDVSSPNTSAANEAAGTTADQGAYNSSENKAPGMGAAPADQGGAGTTGGTLSTGAAAHKLHGTIDSIDAASNSMTLKTASGAQQLTVPSTASIKSKGNKKVAFADLKKGQKVTAQCDASGNATEVWVK